jgi:plasmid replication initiation protein
MTPHRSDRMTRGMSGMGSKHDYELAERDPGKRWVTMSNALTRAGHGLTLAEKRILASAVSKLDSRRAVQPGEVLKTKLTASEYAETFGIDVNTAYEQLQAAAKALYGRSITFYEPAHKRNGAPLAPTKVQMRWVGAVKYQAGEGWVELAWWPDLLRHLTGLQRQFTTYQLQQASALRSAYSWKLLELLKRFESTGHAEYDIEDFKASMDAPPSLTDFGQVKRRIIEPAVNELKAKDHWLIRWDAVKAGKKVRAVRFNFMRDPQGQLQLE